MEIHSLKTSDVSIPEIEIGIELMSGLGIEIELRNRSNTT